LNRPRHPLPAGSGGYHGGGNNDDDGDDCYGGVGRRRSKRNHPPNSCCASRPFDDSDLNLTNTPISSNIPNAGAKNGGVAMPHFYWQEQHNQLSSALYALLVIKDIIHKDAKKSIKTVTTSHFVANGFRVIQQLMRMHHPPLATNQAPLFNQVRDAYPTMRVTISAGEHVDALMGYFMDFVNWEQQIQMYFDSRNNAL
jgi:hypothetical protein